MQSPVKTYTIPAFGLLLRDTPEEAATALERQFNDLYHLFLNKFARLTYDASLDDAETKALTKLLEEIIAVKRKLEE